MGEVAEDLEGDSVGGGDFFSVHSLKEVKGKSKDKKQLQNTMNVRKPGDTRSPITC